MKHGPTTMPCGCNACIKAWALGAQSLNPTGLGGQVYYSTLTGAPVIVGSVGGAGGASYGQPMQAPMPMPMPMPIRKEPDIEATTELIYGWRGWTLGWSWGRPVLMGAKETWETAEKVAICGPAANPAGEARYHLGAMICQCGVYSFKDRTKIHEGYPVVGRVINDGWVVEAELGYRCERVLIERLYAKGLPIDVATAIQERYQVPVEVTSKDDTTTTPEELQLYGGWSWSAGFADPPKKKRRWFS